MDKYNKTSLNIYIIFILAIFLTQIFLYDKTKIEKTDIFSTAIGFITVLFFYFNSQRLINNNLFFKYGFEGFIVFVVCLLKQLLTGFHGLPLSIAGLPFVFILYFRGLTFLFFKDYPNSLQKPIIVFASQYGTVSFDRKDEGYIPTMKEKLFSLLLFMGFGFLAVGLLKLIIVLFKFT